MPLILATICALPEAISDRGLTSPSTLPKTIGFIPSGAKTQKKEFLSIANVMWEQVKMPIRHFLRSDIFTVAIERNSFFVSLIKYVIIYS